MPIIEIDQRTLKVRVITKTSDQYTPDEEVKVIEQEAEKLAKEYNKLLGKVTGLVKKCQEWNKKNDKNYQEAVKKLEEKEESKKVVKKET